MKNKQTFKMVIALVIIGGALTAFVWYIAGRSPELDNEIISKNGLHWHTELSIYVKGEKLDIPRDIGLGAVHNPIHTHDDDNVIHLEFQGIVRKNDLRLGRFFRVWRKDFMEFGPTVRMTVNGEENTELQNYFMNDNDRIELQYE